MLKLKSADFFHFKNQLDTTNSVKLASAQARKSNFSGSDVIPWCGCISDT